MSKGRGHLTQREWDALLEAQGGVCCVKGCGSTGPFDGEHSTPNNFVAGKPDQLMCRPCHKVKTKRDRKAIAKVKRLRGETCNGPKRPIPSAGFRGWRTMGGDIVWRDR